MAKHLKQALILTLKTALAVALIVWLIRNGSLDLNLISQLITPARVAVLVLLVGLQIFINNYRWQLLLQAQGLSLRTSATFPLSLIGMFFNYAMPGGVGGDVVKGFYLIQDHPNYRSAAIISIFMDRMTGFFIMIMTAAFALIWKWETVLQSDALTSLATGVLFVATGFASFFAFALSRRIQNFKLVRIVFEKVPLGRKIERVYVRLHSFRNHMPSVWKAFGLSFIAQFGTIIAVSYIGKWVGITQLSLGDYMFLVPLGTVATALPISPAGIGVGQTAFYFLFNSALGFKSPLGPIAITALQISQFIWGIVGAFFYLRRKPTKLAAEPLAET
jgi:glycosyltransferase 2 family protein